MTVATAANTTELHFTTTRSMSPRSSHEKTMMPAEVHRLPKDKTARPMATAARSAAWSKSRELKTGIAATRRGMGKKNDVSASDNPTGSII